MGGGAAFVILFGAGVISPFRATGIIGKQDSAAGIIGSVGSVVSITGG